MKEEISIVGGACYVGADFSDFCAVFCTELSHCSVIGASAPAAALSLQKGHVVTASHSLTTVQICAEVSRPLQVESEHIVTPALCLQLERGRADQGPPLTLERL